MANRKHFTMSTQERRFRRFSDSFKIQKVQEIERGITRVTDICKEYEVTSPNVYRWIDKFGSMKNKKERLIVESQSDTKKILELKRKVAELEQIIGQKQILIEFKDKMIEIAEETYKVDIKKKFIDKLSGTSGSSGKDTPSV
jgi:transposase-like protein